MSKSSLQACSHTSAGLLPTPPGPADPLSVPGFERTEKGSEVILSSLPVSADAKLVYDLVKEFGAIRTMEGKVTDGRIRIQFRSKESAAHAVARLDGLTIFASQISAELVHRLEFGDVPLWTGVLSKGGKDRADVSVMPFRGYSEAAFQGVTGMKVSHRARIEDVFRKPAFAVVVLVGTSLPQFVTYFRQKQRAGFVQLPRCQMYLLPTECGRVNAEKSDERLLGLLVRFGESL